MYWFVYTITWPLIRLFYPCKVVGDKSALKEKCPQIIICNHLSNIDVIYIASYLRFRFNFLAKKELFSGRFKSWLFRSIGCIPVDRDKVDIASMKKSLKILKENKRLVMFPEGTRNKESEDLQEIKNGAAMFALRTNAKIIPCNIKDRPKLFRRNCIRIGASFDLNQFEGKTNKETLAAASAIIEEKMQNLYK